MVQNEPKIAASRLRRQRIAALHFLDDASDMEGANPLAPPTFFGEKTQVHYRSRSVISRTSFAGLAGEKAWRQAMLDSFLLFRFLWFLRGVPVL